MDSDRIREIQQQTAYPESHSVKGALEQVWNECAQETIALTAQLTSAKEEIERLRETVTDKRLFDKLREALASERKETERLREALRFYAQGKHYILTGAGVAMLRDHGAAARAALQSRQGEE